MHIWQLNYKALWYTVYEEWQLRPIKSKEEEKLINTNISLTHQHINSHACSKLPAIGNSQIPKDADKSFQTLEPPEVWEALENFDNSSS